MRPLSRGYVEARSPNPAEAPAINPRYLSNPTDRRAINRRAALRPPPLCLLVARRYCGTEILPAAAVESDHELLDYARQKGSTIYHATCTCKMGSDQRRWSTTSCACTGWKGLRVVDASVIPMVLRCRRRPVAGYASLTRPTADLPLPAISRMWAAFGHASAPPKPQSSISSALPLISGKIPLMAV